MPLIRLALMAVAVFVYAAPASAQVSLEQALIEEAPGADPKVIRLAVAAMQCASSSAGSTPAARNLAMIDYSRPSIQPRLWVFDLAKRRLLYTEWVAHGRNSGDNFAHSFSNKVGSFETSLGLFRTGQPYIGHNGYSLRMQGLEAGFNDRAEERSIVMHGATYVNAEASRTTGRLGRSQGCPAVRPEVARELIDTIKGGQYLFAYYPDPKWLAASAYLQCPSQPGLSPGQSIATVDGVNPSQAVASSP